MKILALLGVALLAVSQLVNHVDAQIFAAYRAPCMLENPGNDYLSWALIVTCQNYNGSVACNYKREAGDSKAGTCECNLGDAAKFDEDLQMCVGKVGAMCTSEFTGIIPAKLCTANAECVADQGDGYSLGKCRCVYGYVEEPAMGTCIKDADIEDGQRSTPRTTTTQEPPVKPPFVLPPFFVLNTPYNESCYTGIGLNFTMCNSYGSSVGCIDNRCQCILQDDGYFNETLGRCVSKNGVYCSARGSYSGYKTCVDGADCIVTPSSDEIVETDPYKIGYSFGKCECLWGYQETAEGLCERNPATPDPSTARPTTTRQPYVPPTTRDPNASTEGGDGAGALIPALTVVIFMSTILQFFVVP